MQFSTKTQPPATLRSVTTTVTRLTPEVYAELAKQFPTLHVNEQTTPVQVAFSLGVEKVLKKLREGIVVGETHA